VGHDRYLCALHIDGGFLFAHERSYAANWFKVQAVISSGCDRSGHTVGEFFFLAGRDTSFFMDRIGGVGNPKEGRRGSALGHGASFTLFQFKLKEMRFP
jgi:hypothetical protein